ncbi:MAG: hypothetical protein M0R37_12245 [Bacteroidales bacterium]|nr:hypothetical protein [Bacteroidales bacterium]
MDTHPNGIGYDDRVGVAAILHLAETTQQPIGVLLSVGEEIGESSASLLGEYQRKWFSCALVLDRWGTTDLVTRVGITRTCSEDFAAMIAEALRGWGYAPCLGRQSDVVPLHAAIGDAVNLSVGFYSEHTATEYVDWEHVEQLPAIISAALLSITMREAQRH